MAEYNISDIRANGDPQRAYEFEVKIIAAPTAIGWASNQQDILVQRVQQVTIPEVAVEPMQMNFRSSVSMYPGRDSGPHTAVVTFYESEGENTRGMFLNWANIIRNPLTGEGVSGRVAYAGIVGIRQYRTDGSQSNITGLTPAWPSSVGDVSLSYDSNEASTFDVTFSFDEQVSGDQLAALGVSM